MTSSIITQREILDYIKKNEIVSKKELNKEFGPSNIIKKLRSLKNHGLIYLSKDTAYIRKWMK